MYICVSLKPKIMKQTYLNQIQMELALIIDNWNYLFPNDNTSKCWEFFCKEFNIDYDNVVIYEMYCELKNPQ